MSDDAPVWVIGGAELFAATIDRADRLEVTELDLDVEGDTFAPPIGSGWRVDSEGEWQESRSGIRYRFLRYGRVRLSPDAPVSVTVLGRACLSPSRSGSAARGTAEPE